MGFMSLRNTLKRPGNFFPGRFCPQEAADAPPLLVLAGVSRVPVPEAEAAAEAEEAVADKRPSPGSPIRPGTSASQAAAQAAAAAAEVAEAAAVRRNYRSASPGESAI